MTCCLHLSTRASHKRRQISSKGSGCFKTQVLHAPAQLGLRMRCGASKKIIQHGEIQSRVSWHPEGGGGIISFNQASLQIGQFKIKIRSNPTFLNPFPLCPLFFNLVFQPPSFTNLPSSYWFIAFSYVGGIVCVWPVHKGRLLCTLSASPIVHSLNACVYTDDHKYHITNLMSVVHMTHN